VLTQAHASSVLKAVEVSPKDVKGRTIQLVFDRAVDPSQVKTEFFKDIIQLSIEDVSVYPARILPIEGSEIQKLFTYQYTPKLVRARFSVQGKAEDYKDRVSVQSQGKQIVLKLFPKGVKKDQITIAAAQAEKPKPSRQAQEILEQVMRAEEAKPALDAAVTVAAEKKSETARKGAASGLGLKKDSAASSTGLPLKLILLFLAAVGFLGFVLVQLRKKGFENKLGGFMSKLSIPGVSKLDLLRKQKRMIEVVANHYLGPKKSIAVVKIQGRMMVLGITNESINLIAQMPEGASVEQAVAASFKAPELERDLDDPIEFEGALEQKMVKQSRPSESIAPLQSVSARDRIRNRIQGMKPL
jgi:flagellar protein FliO/FliZ